MGSFIIHPKPLYLGGERLMEEYTEEFRDNVIRIYWTLKDFKDGRLPTYEDLYEGILEYLDEHIANVAIDDFDTNKEMHMESAGEDEDEDAVLDSLIEMYRELYWCGEEPMYLDDWIEDIIIKNGLFCIDGETKEIIIGEQTILFEW